MEQYDETILGYKEAIKEAQKYYDFKPMEIGSHIIIEVTRIKDDKVVFHKEWPKYKKNCQC